VARANIIPRGFQEDEKNIFLSFAPLNACRTCDFGLILLVIFLPFLYKSGHLALLRYFWRVGEQVPQPSATLKSQAFTAGFRRLRRKSAEYSTLPPPPASPWTTRAPPRSMQPVCSSSRANSTGSLSNAVMVWESEARAAEEERGRVRRGRGT
jgi:hypothetical protein